MNRLQISDLNSDSSMIDLKPQESTTIHGGLESTFIYVDKDGKYLHHCVIHDFSSDVHVITVK